MSTSGGGKDNKVGITALAQIVMVQKKKRNGFKQVKSRMIMTNVSNLCIDDHN